jgi:16S rRNA (guanine527-N7)-methyltransferase
MAKQEHLHKLLSEMDIVLDIHVCEKLIWYVEELLRWNRRINLTSIDNIDEALEKHLLDALTLLPLLNRDERVLDMGSGAGLPGIPLSLAMPVLRVCSVDRVFKKITFQQHIARLLHLQNFEARTDRLQVLAEKEGYRAAFDVVTARALAELRDLISLGMPFLKPDGRLIAMKGPEGTRELSDCLDLLERQGLVVEKQQELRLPMSGAERTLLVLKRCR